MFITIDVGHEPGPDCAASAITSKNGHICVSPTAIYTDQKGTTTLI